MCRHRLPPPAFLYLSAVNEETGIMSTSTNTPPVLEPSLILQNKEKLIRILDVPDIAWLPRRRHGATLSGSTVFRWCKEGCAGVKLEAIACGGVLCTSEEALKRFFQAADDAGAGHRPIRRLRESRASSRPGQVNTH
jgi:hypothetical protein